MKSFMIIFVICLMMVLRELNGLTLPITQSYQNGTEEFEFVREIRIDSQGSVVVTGITEGSLFGQKIGSMYNENFFIAKYDPNLNLLWAYQNGTEDGSTVDGMDIDSNDDVFITGGEAGYLYAPPMSGDDEDDIFAAKFSGIDGSFIWGTQLGSDEHDNPISGVADNDGKFIMVGYTEGTMYQSSTKEISDALIIKFNGSDGNVVFGKQFGNQEDFERIFNAYIDSNDDIYAAGYSNGTYFGSSYGLFDAFVAKFDGSNGDLIWSFQNGTSEDDIPTGIGFDSSGSLLVTGATKGSWFDDNQGEYDMFFIKYSSTNEFMWGSQDGGNELNVAISQQLDDNDDIWVTGYTLGDFYDKNEKVKIIHYFDDDTYTDESTYTYYLNDFDGIVGKYSGVDGSFLFGNQSAFGSEKNDFLYGLDISNSGEIWVGGWTGGNLFPTRNNTENEGDFFIVQINCSSDCFVCGRGKYHTSLTTCEDCQAGTANDVAGKWECETCVGGPLSNETGLTDCLQSYPTLSPTTHPTLSFYPTFLPSTPFPSNHPTFLPTNSPTTYEPTYRPTDFPTNYPTFSPTLDFQNYVCSSRFAFDDHNCILTSSRQIKCFGRNNYGQLGYGDKITRGDGPNEMGNYLPFVNLENEMVVSVHSGVQHMCALLSSLDIKCWGRNNEGELGYEDDDDRGDNPNEMGSYLLNVDFGSEIVISQLTAGGYHSLIRTDNGMVKAWGDGYDGQLGSESSNSFGDNINEMGNYLPFVDLGSGLTSSLIVAGGQHSCSFLDSGSLKCWGENGGGQLGQGHDNNIGDGSNEMGDNLSPIDFPSIVSPINFVICGFDFCAIISDSGELYLWGYNFSGQLGLGHGFSVGDEPNEMGEYLVSTYLGSGRTMVFVGLGSQHSCAILDNYLVKCFGDGDDGQLGYEDRDSHGKTQNQMGDYLLYVDLGSENTVYSLHLGDYHTCAVLQDNSYKCWGNNDYGQLGRGNTDSIGDESGEMGDYLNAVNLGSGTLVALCNITNDEYYSSYPTQSPSLLTFPFPTYEITNSPTYQPINDPTYHPTDTPTFQPTPQPTSSPSKFSSQEPSTFSPTINPSISQVPTSSPTDKQIQEAKNSPKDDTPWYAIGFGIGVPFVLIIFVAGGHHYYQNLRSQGNF